VVVDGSPGEFFSRVGRPVFSPDGRKAAYAADDGENEYVVIDRTKMEVVGRMGDPVFSPDGSKVGYGARIGREIVWKVLEVP
jgi:Tol biopolymer transport system component